jgi:glycosyltransferase involved in cell wall biosynthesis
MVSGRPIICTKGTYPGAFTEKYDVGLTSEYTKRDLKDTIQKLKENKDLREKLGKNALKQAVEKFNWEKQEEKLVEIYENIC